MKKRNARRRRRQASTVSLPSLFWIFFRIACTSFGGFMAMIAMIQDVVVQRRRLLSQRTMLDGISLASILPGPVAVNTVAYVGYQLRGARGAWVSAIAAILPPFVFILLLSVAYFRWGQMPVVEKIFAGFIPAVAAVIVAAAWNIFRRTVTDRYEAGIFMAAATILLALSGFFSTLIVVVGAGVAGYLMFFEPSLRVRPTQRPARRARKSKTRGSFPMLRSAHAALGTAPLLSAPVASIFAPTLVAKLFFTFGAMSLLLFGGAYVFVPLMQEVVVREYAWVTQREFVDAVALGQLTPGPVLVSAAFIGMKVAGFPGAVAATAGIFLPSAVLMVICARGFNRIKNSARWRSVMRGIYPAVTGMIVVAGIAVARTAIPVWPSVLIFLTALIALLRFRTEVVWIVPPAGLMGLLLY